MKTTLRHLIRVTGTAAGVLWLSSLVFAAQQGADGVAYIAGGVGESGRAEINAMQDQYSLKLVFAYTNGEFLAEVDVVIVDSTGKTLVATDADGPWLLVDLPAGTYEIEATVNGETKTERVTVPASGLKTVNMQWPPA
ncbi:peptidase associated/transthyretin-like domain-containing protein [Halochromatium sp.]